jgi:hypothetical protein
MASAPFQQPEQINLSVVIPTLVESPHDYPARITHPELNGLAFGELAHIRQRRNLG